MDLPMFDLAKSAILAELGRREEARNAIAHILARWPDATIKTIRNAPFQENKDWKRYLDALREAGLPDEK